MNVKSAIQAILKSKRALDKGSLGFLTEMIELVGRVCNLI